MMIIARPGRDVVNMVGEEDVGVSTTVTAPDVDVVAVTVLLGSTLSHSVVDSDVVCINMCPCVHYLEEDEYQLAHSVQYHSHQRPHPPHYIYPLMIY